jgi:hypothetical protein
MLQHTQKTKTTNYTHHLGFESNCIEKKLGQRIATHCHGSSCMKKKTLTFKVAL